VTATVDRCLRCGLYKFDSRPVCAGCGGDRFEDLVMRGTGTVDSFTVVHRRGEEPYVLARVRLTEGPIVLTHLIDEPDPRCDQRVRVCVHNDRMAFRPDDRPQRQTTRSDDGL
jgi:uncharacterized OB-fold protein